MVPDINHTVVTAGYGSLGTWPQTTLTTTARSSDGQTIIAYIPNGNAATITVDMTKITSATNTAQCWWFNPSNGSTTLIGSFPNSGTQNFTPPDSNDWVLVIDDVGATLAAPGSTHPQVSPLALVSPSSPDSRAKLSALPALLGWPDWTLVAGLAFVGALIVAVLRSRKRTQL